MRQINNYIVVREKCPICNSKEYDILYECSYNKSPISEILAEYYHLNSETIKEYLNTYIYILCKCNNCKSIYQKQILDDFLLKKLYEEWIDPDTTFNMDVSNVGKDVQGYYAHEILMMSSLFKKKKDDIKMLDFGMGWGRFCKAAKDLGVNIYGAELSKSRIEYAKSLGVELIDLDNTDKDTFDFINTEQVFEHVSNPRDILSQLIGLLKPNGVLKICVPNGQNVYSEVKNLKPNEYLNFKKELNPIHPLEHINCYNKESLILMANDFGLKRVRISFRLILLPFFSKKVKLSIRMIAKVLYRNFYWNSTYIFFIKG